MQRHDSHARAAEIAQRAIALMAERRIAPTPQHFELWYAYVAGELPELTSAINLLIGERKPFDPATLARLHAEHLGLRDTGREIDDVGRKMHDEIDSVLQKIEEAGRHTEHYGRQLTEASGQLAGADGETADLKALIAGILSATRAMEERAQRLETELQKSSSEIADLRTKLEDVRMESRTDPLTGLANRKIFDMELSASCLRAMEACEPLSLLMCDIDYFKKFNDTWGHQTGDQVLRLVANCLSETVKGRDTAVRYGGEEFAVILPQTALTDAARLAEQIRHTVEAKKLIKKSTGHILGTITVSIGVAQFIPGERESDLVQRADNCLYAAKRAGRNRVVASHSVETAAA